MDDHSGVGFAVLAAALAAVAPVGAKGNCEDLTGTLIAAELTDNAGGTTRVRLLLLPGGIAEYRSNGACSVLTFTDVKDGNAIYTDDGIGRGLTVAISKDHHLTVSHVSGWTARSR